jgi:hypothetical protein
MGAEWAMKLQEKLYDLVTAWTGQKMSAEILTNTPHVAHELLSQSSLRFYRMSGFLPEGSSAVLCVLTFT